MRKEFKETGQRPFPLPSRPWMMTQRWDFMLLAHWPVPPALLARHVPSALSLDLFNGRAWISIVPFLARHTRLHGLPRFPFYHTYLELNVRTYVTYKGIPGIYFFSLDADKWPVVFGARTAAFLPYFHARMKLDIKGETIHFHSRRHHAGQPAETFDSAFSPSSPVFLPEKESLDWWLLERYCFWIQKSSRLYRGDIHHDRWRIAKARCSLHNQTMASFLPRNVFSGDPLFHFSHQKNVFIWPLKAAE